MWQPSLNISFDYNIAFVVLAYNNIKFITIFFPNKVANMWQLSTKIFSIASFHKMFIKQYVIFNNFFIKKISNMWQLSKNNICDCSIS